MKANSDKSKQSKKATRRVLAGVLCGASVLSLVLSLVMPPISQAIANDGQTGSTEETVTGDSSSESTGVDSTADEDTENQYSDDAENGETNADAAGADQLSNGAEAESAVQPADDGANGEDSTALTGVNTSDYIEIEKDVTDKFDNGGNYRLKDDAWSKTPITINNDTTIDLAGHKLYYRDGNNDTFITVLSGALTVEDSAQVSDIPSDADNDPGKLATMAWTGDNNGTPQSLTYYETTSTPNTDNLGTTETCRQRFRSNRCCIRQGFGPTGHLCCGWRHA